MVKSKKKSEKVESENKVTDPLSLEGIGLGPAQIKTLNQNGIFTSFQLIHKSPVWLHHTTDHHKDKCAIIFKEARARLEAAGLVDPQEMSGTESVARRQNVKRIGFDCPPIDNITNGGIEVGAVTQVYGRDGGGKTQTAHLLTVQVQRPVKDGGLAKTPEEIEEIKQLLAIQEKKLNGATGEERETIGREIRRLQYEMSPPLVYFIATENTWRPERVTEIAASKGLIIDFPEDLKLKKASGKTLTIEEQKLYQEIKQKQDLEAAKFLDNVIVKRVTNADAQNQAIHDLIKMVQDIPFKLIIVDSGTALVRGSYQGQANMNPKSEILNTMCQNLLNIAELNNIAILFVNQIWINPYPEYGADEEEPYGGKIVGHVFPYIYKVDKSGSRHRLTIIKSPYQANNSVRFEITASGFTEVKEGAKKDEQ